MSTPAPDEALSVDTVLVPVDGSDESIDAVEYAVAIAEEYEASVYAVYVVGQDVVRAVEDGAVDAEEVSSNSTSFMEDVEPIAEAHGVALNHSTAYGFSTTRKTQHPGSVVLDTADEVDADFLVVPREPMSESGDVLAKAAEYVLLYASQPLLSV
ncbi:universal stress protein [Halorubellus sp. JP-L1]|uniref:universal stress protein n=1 Tax=Halorubellus sp. JP-L1 TaxID=2715753 RepID=UPI0014093AE9|nr:universal stress protein [Halorubellus sp. JP-L1]NHN41591.1 universal stress protein [Halorubellus sp. JP-L1]